MDTSEPHQVNNCWNSIGVYGDRSCVELETVIHCRNCPVYATAGRSLLERDVPIDYLNEWTAVLAEPQEPSQVINEQAAFRIGRAADTFAAIIFRVSDELFALPVGVLQEVTPPCVIHALPHRSNDLFLGLVNIRGEMMLCASLGDLLGLETVTKQPLNSAKEQRMLVVGKNGKWVFPVDEVHRIYRFHLNEFKATPVVISKSTETYTQGIIDWHNKKVNYLDAELLLDTLDRRIL